MTHRMMQLLGLLLAVVMLIGTATNCASAADVAEDPVAAVIRQLEEIDTLEQMQAKRASYAVKSRYTVSTTDSSVIAAHENARAQYEAYRDSMFAARLAAQQAYDALSASQQAQISSSLTSKLSQDLPTSFRSETMSLTPGNQAYTFMAVNDSVSGGLCYEVSNHASGTIEIPAIFILVDTADGASSWTPSGRYQPGESNFDVAYCCDVHTILNYGSHYKRINLEDSSYYGPSASRHIRAILENAYPFLSLDEMKSRLKAGGMKSDFVDSLTRSDVIAAVQLAIWAYANAGETTVDAVRYGTSYDVVANRNRYMNPLHEYTNELWDWWTTAAGNTSYDANAEYRVNTLVYYLCNLSGQSVSEDEIVISEVEVTRADLISESDDLYQLGMYIHLNSGGSRSDDLRVSVTSYHINEDGSRTETGRNAQSLNGRTLVDMYVRAKPGDTIQVVVEGTQTLERGVYFYEPEGGRDASQCLVGVSEGETRVHAEKEFTFAETIGETGLRLYKTALNTGMPLEGITFHIYRVLPGEGQTVSSAPTQEELTWYATEENRLASIVTDATGYASLALDEGTYLIVEEHNPDKIISPVSPFYISIPLAVSRETEDGTTVVDMMNIVSVYPKNVPVDEEEEPPIIPPVPDNVTGQFEIIKHAAGEPDTRLSGAQFEVYRAATDGDDNVKTVVCDGTMYAVTPVKVNGSRLVLTTDSNGHAVSPQLTCGTYFLVETKAPDGYYLLEEAVSVRVVSSILSSSTTVTIANTPGVQLPETGGSGWDGYALLGCALMLGALAVLVLRKRTCA